MRRQKASKFLFSVLFVILTVLLSSEVVAEGPLSVELSNSRVTLLAENRMFGDVLRELSRAAGFTTDIPPELSGKRVSIRFADLNLDRAIVRLFSLVQERNFRVKYDTSGNVVKIEVITEKRIHVEEKDRRGSERIGQKASKAKRSRYAPGRIPRRYRPKSENPPTSVSPPGNNVEDISSQ